MMKVNCLLCGKECEVVRLLSMPNMPSCAQNLPRGEDFRCDHGMDFDLVQCMECGLVQLDCPPVDYYRDVIRAGGGTSTMLKLRKEQYRQLIDMGCLEGKRVLEVGCGAGEFLAMLSAFPVKGVGIENNATLVERAKKAGLEVFKGFAERPGQKIVGAPYDAFVQFNFIEHQPNPNGMVGCIRDNLVPGGWGLITAPSFEYIQNNCVYEIMRDHIAYYTEGTLAYLFMKNGFDVISSERVNGGDTLSLIVRKREFLQEDMFIRNYFDVKKRINAFLDDVTAEGRRIAFWGASHQCFTASAFIENPSRVTCIIDSADFKQGCVSPVSHIPIIAPDKFFSSPTESVLIVAPGYTEEIAKVIRSRSSVPIQLFALRTDAVEEL